MSIKRKITQNIYYNIYDIPIQYVYIYIYTIDLYNISTYNLRIIILNATAGLNHSNMRSKMAATRLQLVNYTRIERHPKLMITFNQCEGKRLMTTKKTQVVGIYYSYSRLLVPGLDLFLMAGENKTYFRLLIYLYTG